MQQQVVYAWLGKARLLKEPVLAHSKQGTKAAAHHARRCNIHAHLDIRFTVHATNEGGTQAGIVDLGCSRHTVSHYTEGVQPRLFASMPGRWLAPQ